MKRALFPIGVVALAITLGFALVQLFGLRFERGDIYPPASTLRADPLGTKALYDALAGVDGYGVERNYRPLTKRRPGKPFTLVYAGVARKSVWGEQEIRTLEALVAHGSRAVFAFAPENFDRGPSLRSTFATVGAKKAKKPPAPAPPPTPASPPSEPGSEGSTVPAAPVPSPDEPTDDGAEDVDGVKFSDRLRGWGSAFALPRIKPDGMAKWRAVATKDAPGLEPDLPWHSAIYFKDLSEHWRTLYTCEGRPVIIERAYGDGTIVLAADSYFLSNEALRAERSPRFLAWFLGPPQAIVFDEEHHGIREEANIALLVRKYRLHGVLAGLILIGGLALWKAALPLVPKRGPSSHPDAEVHGKDADAGFINLLRRSIPPGQILATCVAEWQKTTGRRASAAERNHVEAVVRAHDGRSGRNAVAAYRTIAEGLAGRRRSRGRPD